jgi:YebC/PmpR family DNA-binding regulatory protein
MSGHSKWASIKHKKGALDAKRGKIFTKIIRELQVAARAGGGNPDTNPSLRTVILKAKANNMPQDNVERAIKRGTGELEGVSYEEITYEGYGAQGVAVLVECLTDNKNRTAAEIRSIFTKNNGNLAAPNAVAWMFEKKGVIRIPGSQMEEEKVMDLALNAGAEDLSNDENVYEITTAPSDFEAVKDALAKAGLKPESAEVTMVPKNVVDVGEANAKSILNLMEALEDHDDVKNAYSNFNIPEEILKKFA